MLAQNSQLFRLSKALKCAVFMITWPEKEQDMKSIGEEDECFSVYSQMESVVGNSYCGGCCEGTVFTFTSAESSGRFRQRFKCRTSSPLNPHGQREELGDSVVTEMRMMPQSRGEAASVYPEAWSLSENATIVDAVSGGSCEGEEREGTAMKRAGAVDVEGSAMKSRRYLRGGKYRDSQKDLEPVSEQNWRKVDLRDVRFENLELRHKSDVAREPTRMTRKNERSHKRYSRVERRVRCPRIREELSAAHSESLCCEATQDLEQMYAKREHTNPRSNERADGLEIPAELNASQVRHNATGTALKLDENHHNQTKPSRLEELVRKTSADCNSDGSDGEVSSRRGNYDDICGNRITTLTSCSPQRTGPSFPSNAPVACSFISFKGGVSSLGKANHLYSNDCVKGAKAGQDTESCTTDVSLENNNQENFLTKRTLAASEVAFGSVAARDADDETKMVEALALEIDPFYDTGVAGTGPLVGLGATTNLKSEGTTREAPPFEITKTSDASYEALTDVEDDLWIGGKEGSSELRGDDNIWRERRQRSRRRSVKGTRHGAHELDLIYQPPKQKSQGLSALADGLASRLLDWYGSLKNDCGGESSKMEFDAQRPKDHPHEVISSSFPDIRMVQSAANKLHEDFNEPKRDVTVETNVASGVEKNSGSSISDGIRQHEADENFPCKNEATTESQMEEKPTKAWTQSSEKKHDAVRGDPVSSSKLHGKRHTWGRSFKDKTGEKVGYFESWLGRGRKDAGSSKRLSGKKSGLKRVDNPQLSGLIAEDVLGGFPSLNITEKQLISQVWPNIRSEESYVTEEFELLEAVLESELSLDSRKKETLDLLHMEDTRTRVSVDSAETRAEIMHEEDLTPHRHKVKGSESRPNVGSDAQPEAGTRTCIELAARENLKYTAEQLEGIVQQMKSDFEARHFEGSTRSAPSLQLEKSHLPSSKIPRVFRGPECLESKQPALGVPTSISSKADIAFRKERRENVPHSEEKNKSTYGEVSNFTGAGSKTFGDCQRGDSHQGTAKLCRDTQASVVGEQCSFLFKKTSSISEGLSSSRERSGDVSKPHLDDRGADESATTSSKHVLNDRVAAAEERIRHESEEVAGEVCCVAQRLSERQQSGSENDREAAVEERVRHDFDAVAGEVFSVAQCRSESQQSGSGNVSVKMDEENAITTEKPIIADLPLGSKLNQNLLQPKENPPAPEEVSKKEEKIREIPPVNRRHKMPIVVRVRNGLANGWSLQSSIWKKVGKKKVKACDLQVASTKGINQREKNGLRLGLLARSCSVGNSLESTLQEGNELTRSLVGPATSKRENSQNSRKVQPKVTLEEPCRIADETAEGRQFESGKYDADEECQSPNLVAPGITALLAQNKKPGRTSPSISDADNGCVAPLLELPKCNSFQTGQIVSDDTPVSQCQEDKVVKQTEQEIGKTLIDVSVEDRDQQSGGNPPKKLSRRPEELPKYFPAHACYRSTEVRSNTSCNFDEGRPTGQLMRAKLEHQSKSADVLPDGETPLPYLLHGVTSTYPEVADVPNGTIRDAPLDVTVTSSVCEVGSGTTVKDVYDCLPRCSPPPLAPNLKQRGANSTDCKAKSNTRDVPRHSFMQPDLPVAGMRRMQETMHMLDHQVSWSSWPDENFKDARHWNNSHGVRSARQIVSDTQDSDSEDQPYIEHRQSLKSSARVHRNACWTDCPDQQVSAESPTQEQVFLDRFSGNNTDRYGSMLQQRRKSGYDYCHSSSESPGNPVGSLSPHLDRRNTLEPRQEELHFSRPVSAPNRRAEPAPPQPSQAVFPWTSYAGADNPSLSNLVRKPGARSKEFHSTYEPYFTPDFRSSFSSISPCSSFNGSMENTSDRTIFTPKPHAHDSSGYDNGEAWGQYSDEAYDYKIFPAQPSVPSMPVWNSFPQVHNQKLALSSQPTSSGGPRLLSIPPRYDPCKYNHPYAPSSANCQNLSCVPMSYQSQIPKMDPSVVDAVPKPPLQCTVFQQTKGPIPFTNRNGSCRQHHQNSTHRPYTPPQIMQTRRPLRPWSCDPAQEHLSPAHDINQLPDKSCIRQDRDDAERTGHDSGTCKTKENGLIWLTEEEMHLIRELRLSGGKVMRWLSNITELCRNKNEHDCSPGHHMIEEQSSSSLEISKHESFSWEMDQPHRNVTNRAFATAEITRSGDCPTHPKSSPLVSFSSKNSGGHGGSVYVGERGISRASSTSRCSNFSTSTSPLHPAEVADTSKKALAVRRQNAAACIQKSWRRYLQNKIEDQQLALGYEATPAALSLLTTLPIWQEHVQYSKRQDAVSLCPPHPQALVRNSLVKRLFTSIQKAARVIQRAWRAVMRRRKEKVIPARGLPKDLKDFYEFIKVRHINGGFQAPSYKVFVQSVQHIQAGTEGARVRRRMKSRRLQTIIMEIKEIRMLLFQMSEERDSNPYLYPQLCTQLQQKILQLHLALTGPQTARNLIIRDSATPLAMYPARSASNSSNVTIQKSGVQQFLQHSTSPAEPNKPYARSSPSRQQGTKGKGVRPENTTTDPLDNAKLLPWFFLAQRSPSRPQGHRSPIDSSSVHRLLIAKKETEKPAATTSSSVQKATEAILTYRPLSPRIQKSDPDGNESFDDQPLPLKQQTNMGGMSVEEVAPGSNNANMDLLEYGPSSDYPNKPKRPFLKRKSIMMAPQKLDWSKVKPMVSSRLEPELKTKLSYCRHTKTINPPRSTGTRIKKENYSQVKSRLFSYQEHPRSSRRDGGRAQYKEVSEAEISPRPRSLSRESSVEGTNEYGKNGRIANYQKAASPDFLRLKGQVQADTESELAFRSAQASMLEAESVSTYSSRFASARYLHKLGNSEQAANSSTVESNHPQPQRIRLRILPGSKGNEMGLLVQEMDNQEEMLDLWADQRLSALKVKKEEIQHIWEDQRLSTTQGRRRQSHSHRYASYRAASHGGAEPSGKLDESRRPISPQDRRTVKAVSLNKMGVASKELEDMFEKVIAAKCGRHIKLSDLFEETQVVKDLLTGTPANFTITSDRID